MRSSVASLLSTLSLSLCRDPDLENSGRYTCNVVNDVGAAMASSHVIVYNNRSRSGDLHYKVLAQPLTPS